MEMRNREEWFFLILLFLTLIAIAIIAGAIWYLQVVGITSITRFILTSLSVILSVILVIFALGFGSIVLILILERPISWLILPTHLAVEYLFPLAIFAARLFGYSKEDLLRSFIQISNRLVGIRGIRIKGEDLLVLLPHCIQKFDCKYKVTSDVENCRRCGQCAIDKLLDLKEKYGFHMAVATGGTLARKWVKEIKPKAIVAVACERDLASGIQDTYPLPVTGVINIRPEGPCINTSVDVDDMEKAILKFLERSD